jgi:hypothetical protein
MAYRDLITFERLRQANVSDAVIAQLTGKVGQAKSLIRQVSRLVEYHLGMTGRRTGLIVRRHTQVVERYEWTESEALGSYLTWADQRPVVEIAAESEDLAGVEVPRTTDRKLKRSRPKPGTVTYFGGYRRPDQVLTSSDEEAEELPTGDGEALDGLSTLPPELPGTIQTVTANITLHVLQNRGQGNLGRRTQQSFGEQQVTIEGADPQFITRELSRLNASPDRRLIA